MDQERSLSQRILQRYDDMPRGERRLADVLLERPTALFERSATDLAQRASVSKATAARFFKRLGYPSFRAARRLARAEGVEAPPPQYGARIRALPGRRPDLGEHLQGDVQNLIRTIEQQSADELDLAARLMARADKLWVVGFGENYPLAHFARALLIKIRPDIRMIPIGGFSVPEEFASISASDSMLAFGFGRRTRALRDLLGSAQRSGVHIVFITDLAGPGEGAEIDVTLRCRTAGASIFDSMTAPVSLLTYLCSALAARAGDGAIERLRTIESIHAEWGEPGTSWD